MNRGTIPAFELEKGAIQTDVENGLMDGVSRLHGKEPEKREDHFHNTRELLRQYRRVSFATKVSEEDLNLRMEIEHSTQLSPFELNAELAGIDLSGTKLESYTRSVVRSRKMLTIIRNALETVRQDPDHGDLLYHLLELTYFSERPFKNREAILDELDRLGYPMSVASYTNYLRKGIRAIDHILWGYTTLDCMEIIRNFLP